MSSKQKKPTGQTWRERLDAKGFREQLAGAIEAMARDFGERKFGDVVDPVAVREVLERSEDLLDHEVAAELITEAAQRVRKALEKEQPSAEDLFSPALAEEIDELMDRDVALSRDAEALVGRMMRRELITDLFTDVIHTSIVSFNKKVNPLFGGLATSMLEDQIKGFIRFFMPLVQDQATAFVVDRENQDAFSDFARSLIRELMQEPIPNLMTLVSSDEEVDSKTLAKKFAQDERLRAFSREMSLVVWDAVYKKLRKRKIGKLVRLEENAAWIGEQGATIILASLREPELAAAMETLFVPMESDEPKKS